MENLKIFLIAAIVILLASVSVKAAQHSVKRCEAQAMNQDQVRNCINL